ncbi:MAG TPA: hypothetical protein VLE89_06800 [Chlamydiales bacterium]|nr:hypothetical protein [Chlamydiales bacterium]
MRLLFILALFPFYSWADKAAFPTAPDVQSPWLTGPLLASSAYAVPIGHYYIEPYIYAVANSAIYDHEWNAVEIDTLWNFSLQPYIQIGLTPWMDFQISPTLFYNFREGGGANWAWGDLPIGLDMMLFQRGKNATDWLTAVKISLKEILPTGKYQNLNPKKLRTDIGGQGSWNTSFLLVWGQLVHISGKIFFDTRLNLQYSLPAPVHVKGFNSYGGGYGTNGTVYPAQNFEVDLGMELTLTQNWVLAMDIVGLWSGRTRFKGTLGSRPDGTPAIIGPGSAVQYSLAPAIEYNWSQNIGIIAGSWFTVAGRNSLKFSSGIIAFSYYK